MRRVIHVRLRDDQLPGDQQILEIAHAIEVSVQPTDAEAYIKVVVGYIADQFEFALRTALKVPHAPVIVPDSQRHE